MFFFCGNMEYVLWSVSRPTPRKMGLPLEASLKPDPELAFFFDFLANLTPCITLIDKGMCMTA
jgi:hypothetical protein